MIARRLEPDNPNAIYCFDIRRNGHDENGNKLYSWDDKLIDVESSYSNGILTIKENVTTIGNNAFKGCKSVTYLK